MYNFGAGRAYLYPAGMTSTTNTGIELGTVQNASLELKVEMKELRGPFRYPVAVADGKGTASGKVTFANIWPQTIAAIAGGTVQKGAINPSTGGYPDNAAGGLQASISESFTVPATPYQYTLTNATTYLPLTEIVIMAIPNYGPVYYQRGAAAASATVNDPTAGRYTIVTSTGVLTFASTDTLLVGKVTYLYSLGSGAANAQVGVALQQVGLNTALTFQLNLIGTGRDYYTNGAQQFIVQLNACLAPSLKFDFKLDDFTMVDLDFDAFIDIQGNLGYFYLLNP